MRAPNHVHNKKAMHSRIEGWVVRSSATSLRRPLQFGTSGHNNVHRKPISCPRNLTKNYLHTWLKARQPVTNSSHEAFTIFIEHYRNLVQLVRLHPESRRCRSSGQEIEIKPFKFIRPVPFPRLGIKCKYICWEPANGATSHQGAASSLEPSVEPQAATHAERAGDPPSNPTFF
ncbi:hypothetical protein VNO77_27321 [Canavalia gladiata]|uniref:Uncharacterized protein n=1 Tax=Canavalia gladiata TaxID=3824 RepID=A0AAN9Q6D5_CANGL